MVGQTAEGAWIQHQDGPSAHHRPAPSAEPAGEGGAAAPAPGIGFAIPSNVVTDIAGQLIAHNGHVVDSHRAQLGVQVTTVVDPTGQPFGKGVEITASVEGATLSGTVAVKSDGSGIARFSDLMLTGAAGSYPLIFSAAMCAGSVLNCPGSRRT